MIASQSPFSTPLASANSLSNPIIQNPLISTRRVPTVHTTNQTLLSPTASESSDNDVTELVKNWTEEKVCEWLRSINSAEYVPLFRSNNINGENLLEIDKSVLHEMGIHKVGDRVRLFLNIKKLRTKAYAYQKKRSRDSFTSLDTFSSISSESPWRPNTGNRTSGPNANKKHSRKPENFASTSIISEDAVKPDSKSTSSNVSETRATRQQRTYGAFNKSDMPRMDNNPSSTSTSSNLTSLNRRKPSTPPEIQQSQSQTINLDNSHNRSTESSSVQLKNKLSNKADKITVITSGGSTKNISVSDCSSCDEMMRMTLKKFGYREDHDRNYCFYVLDGFEPKPNRCKKLSESELWRIVKDPERPERNRLILRKIHQGEPGEAELQRAVAIAKEEASTAQVRPSRQNDEKSHLSTPRISDENWRIGPEILLSPSSYAPIVSADERERNVHNAAKDLERPIMERTRDPGHPKAEDRKGVLRQFFGARPPSELITSDLTTYFPDHPREEIDRTARMSLRRSTRLSKYNSRLSVASNFSYASSIDNAPPMPTIADTWLSGSSHVAKIKPLDVLRPNTNQQNDFISSPLLGPQRDKSSTESTRKSFSSSDSRLNATTGMNNESDSHSGTSFFEDGSSDSGVCRDLSQVLNDDGEEEDSELQSFLAGDSWDDSKWMKGALIGQGSFGSVYLALHAVTGELLAVKQVETLSPGANNANDARKKSMIDAMKREISFLRDLQHPNIVQYLGASSSTDHLNIFLEYVPGGSVQTMLNSYGALQEPLIRNFVRQIVTGLAYLHNRDIIHRDIKGANILVDNKGGIKISDFGISKKIEASNLLGGPGTNKNRPSLQGSVYWMAPEVVKQTSYTRKADIWSLGCLVVEMMTGTHPFPDCSQLQAIFKIGGAKVSPTVPSIASHEAQIFLKKAFEVEHTKRPTAEELLISPFLNPMT